MSETIGVTGSRSLDPMRDIPKIMAVLETLPKGSTLVTGACVGVDSFVASQAKGLGLKVHTIVPADRSRVDRFWREYADTFEEMPEGTSYLARNIEIVKASERRLLGFPQADEGAAVSRRSGSWQTIRLGKKAGLDVLVTVLGE